MKSKTLKINFPWTAISVFIAVVSLGVSVWNARYDTSGAQSASSTKIQYYVDKSVATCDANPSKGGIYFGINQTKGKTGTKYTVNYKANSSSNWKFFSGTLTADKNNTYYGPKHLFNSTGTQKYNFKITKNNNTTTESIVQFDWALK